MSVDVWSSFVVTFAFSFSPEQRAPEGPGLDAAFRSLYSERNYKLSMTNLIPVRKWLMLWDHCYCSENNYNIPVNRERWACNRRHALSSRLIVSLSDSWRNPFNDQHCDVRWSAADTIFNVRTCWVTSRLSEFIWADRLWTSSLLVWCNSSLSRTARYYLQIENSNIFLEICSNYFWL